MRLFFFLSFYTVYCHAEYQISRWWHLVFLFDLMNSCILPRLHSNLSLMQVWKIPEVERSPLKRSVCDSWLHSLLCENSTCLSPTLVRNNLGNKFIPMYSSMTLGLMSFFFFPQCTQFLLCCGFLGISKKNNVMLVFGLSLVAQGISGA